MKNLITLLTATLLAASAPLVHAQEKSATPTPVATAPATPAAPVSADGPKTRAQVRAELEEARRRGELEAGFRWGFDQRSPQR
jgi:hypothetical protein